MTREYTNKLYEMMDDGLLSPELIVEAFCKYCSEDDVREMMFMNEFVMETEDWDE
jgi:hypothetical protein